MSEELEQGSDLVIKLLKVLKNKGQKELGRLATDSRRVLELRSLKKDRIKMYEKLGKEVEALIAAGDITHPGLIRGVQRIQSLDEQIDRLDQEEET
ncbi:MAG: hypothetical protein VX278_12410 [Myxococcota bacterium]|nr:hypothetical protein [Myxococcota bacterium]